MAGAVCYRTVTFRLANRGKVCYSAVMFNYPESPSQVNRYPYRFNVAEEVALSRSSLYQKAKSLCPTCRGTGRYKHDGVEVDCERDGDYSCIQGKLFRKYIVANIPWDYMTLDWKDFRPSVKATIDDYIENVDTFIRGGIGLYIHSVELGTGKTFASTHILKEASKRGHSVYFCPFFDILDLHNNENKTYVESKLEDSDLIVIDDVTIPTASAKQAAYFEMTLERVIRHRVHNGLSTVVTSNMTIEDLKDYYNRIFSLLSQSCTTVSLEKEKDARITSGVTDRVTSLLQGEVRPIT